MVVVIVAYNPLTGVSLDLRSFEEDALADARVSLAEMCERFAGAGGVAVEAFIGHTPQAILERLRLAAAGAGPSGLGLAGGAVGP